MRGGQATDGLVIRSPACAALRWFRRALTNVALPGLPQTPPPYDAYPLPAAISEYREVVRIRPESARDLLQLGHLLRAVDDLDEAIVQYRRAVVAAPEKAAPHLSLGDALLARGDLDGAIASFREAIAIEPDAAAGRERLERALRVRAERAGGAQSSEAGAGAGTSAEPPFDFPPAGGQT